MTCAQKISVIEWSVIAAVVLGDVILAAMTDLPVRVSARSLTALGIIWSLWPLTFLLVRSTGFAKGAQIIPENVAKYFIFIAAASVLEYYAATSPLPLNDDRLISADRLLGFDWPAFYRWTNAHTGLHRFLAFCYAGLMAEAGVVLLVVGVFYPQRANRFSTALIISALITIACVGLFPVAGPFVHFGHTDLPQANYTEHYLALRAHAMPFIPVDHLRGIISFPSFHVSSAVIMSYFLRRIPVLFPLSVLLNIGMSIGALVIGGHYLTDVLAGVALSLVTIFAIVWLERNMPEKRLPLFRPRTG